MKLWTPAIALILAGCGASQNPSSLDEAWDTRNDPIIMDTSRNYEKNFANLPRSANLSKQPWSGDYWASYRGGISYRWNASVAEIDRYRYDPKPYYNLSQNQLRQLSPAEKYDILRGRRDYPLTQSERRRTRVLQSIPGRPEYIPGYKIPTWEGLCHAWAPATYSFEEPQPVTMRSPEGIEVPFGSSDIKALITYFMHQKQSSARTQFLGRRCNESFENLSGEALKKAKESSACRDVNAGAFHVVISNQIGIADESFVVDVTRDAEVWNQAIEGYSVQVVERRPVEQGYRNMAQGTETIVRVKTTMAYTVEVPSRWAGDTIKGPGTFRPATYRVTYDYWLELDAWGDILGGKWNTETRPDFLWKQTIPDFGAEWSELRKLYQASINGGVTPPEPGPQPEPPTDDMKPGFQIKFTHNKCVDIIGGVARSGQAVVQRTCDGRATQRWNFVARGNGWSLIQSAANPELCLDLESSSMQPGSRIIAYRCTGTSNQLWQITRFTFPGTANPEFTAIKVGHGSNMCMAPHPSQYYLDRAQLGQYQCTGNSFDRIVTPFPYLN
ncbi:RICIN domain-containing protein [Pseudobacteriovorax antillogorgiicola]|uniref:Ricin-type beta-trefoil lectin domain-containing protein n=1 Tax=Pseudobacteriovorax antillogorgiicola TaxID=1513793 RepID=A0A1Y6BF48_9BACT|nr:RICIN domain-containing protein [Pseudobacteriovorax antillogorgiicola]TCS57460.1 ricin-type beta-trefoil lectin protein [Pseudobacteriovorax antillogorgiicola]SMF00781.1 Ricin-type beta-trefoil lectin domain-containing protein [Pseudobacteriovorax antillogorgiicola]